MTQRLVAELQLDRVAARMATAAAGRRLAHEAQRHLQAGMPQLAVFAFDHVGRSIALWGRYEREELDLLMRAATPLVDRAGVCLDIGANVGNHALFFAEHFAQVLAFEPNPRTFALLQFNAALRGNVRCFDFGLSDADGLATLTVPRDNAGMATLHGGSGDAVACQLRRLDDLELVASQRVSLIKIDVEGHEAAVLRGARGLLLRDRPLVVFEQAAAGVRSDGGCDVMDLLRDCGYSRWWTMEQLPDQGPGRWRPLTLLRRLVGGERLRLLEVDRLAPRFHSMVVALPAPK